MKQGLLLINLGTPLQPTSREVRRYLYEFLKDPRVINIPALFRYLLLYGVILPFRTRRSVEAYQQIWTDKGSPLLLNSLALRGKVQEKLGQTWVVDPPSKVQSTNWLIVKRLPFCHSIHNIPQRLQEAAWKKP